MPGVKDAIYPQNDVWSPALLLTSYSKHCGKIAAVLDQGSECRPHACGARVGVHALASGGGGLIAPGPAFRSCVFDCFMHVQ